MHSVWEGNRGRMVRKLSIEIIRKEFEARGYILLEDKYAGQKQKLKYKCPKHPDKELSITYSNFFMGKGCPYCKGKGKPTFEEVQKIFHDRGYTLLETKYINGRTKMRFLCSKHSDKEK